jgi:hypothetical protein
VNGLAAEMAALLESKVYVGVSAGSMIFSRNMANRTGEVCGEQEELRILGDTPARPPFGLYDWYVKPHLNSLDYSHRTRSPPVRCRRRTRTCARPACCPFPLRDMRDAAPRAGRVSRPPGRAAPSPAAG